MLSLPLFALACAAIFGTAFASFGIVFAGSRLTLARLPLAPDVRGAWLAGITVFLVGWFAVALACARPGWFGGWAGLPVPLVALLTLVLPAVGGTIALLTVRPLRDFVDALPPHWLPALQTFRLLGGIFLLYLAFGLLPAGFVLPASIGDILTGLAAPFVARALARRAPYALTAAVAWNIFGLLDFVSAVGAARYTGAVPPFPVWLIPGYFVPLCILFHVASLRNLRANRAILAGP